MAQSVRQDQRRSELVATLLDPQTRDELRALAEREDRSVASIVRRAVARELERDHEQEGDV